MGTTFLGAPNSAPDSQAPQTEEQILASAGEDEGAEANQLLPGLTPDLEKELVGLVTSFERESYTSWRTQFREFLEAESFWKDIQHGFYDRDSDTFRTPTALEMGANRNKNTTRFEFATNHYRTMGWTIISVLGQKIPSIVWMPVDYTNEASVRAARAAQDVQPIIERNNRTGLLHMKAVYHLFTGGIFGGYVRYIADGERYGYSDQPEMAMVRVAKCPDCGEYGPLDSTQPITTCPACGVTGDASLAEVIEVPQVVGTRQVAKGQEVISIHGPLELRLPPWVQDQADALYLGLTNEQHKAMLRALYGARVEKVSGGFGDAGADASWDRHARLALIEATGSYHAVANPNLVTLKRYWLRRSSLYGIKDKEKRDSLLQIFKKGAYVAFAEDGSLLDARDELLDNHWRLCRGMEGHAMFTPALGQSAISLQKRINMLNNFVMEWVEYSAAGQGTFVNSGLLNIDALRKQRRAPGMLYPLRLPTGARLADAVYTDRPTSVPAEIFRHEENLVGDMQSVTGAVPTVSGGTEQSLKPTTYLADREQALGKMFVPWLHLRFFWSEMMLLSVKLFGQNRTDESISYSQPGQLPSEPLNKTVVLQDLSGEFDAFPETNETFPRLWHQQQAMFLQLLQSQDPMIAEILSSAPNLPFAKVMLGMPTLYVPNEDDSAKQRIEIGQLLQQQPTLFLDPITGMPKPMASLPPDEFEDNHAEHIATIRRWAVSPAGIRTKTENPMGYQNVIAHGKAHLDIEMMQQAQAAMLMAPPPEPGDDKGGKAPAGGGSKSPNESKMNRVEGQKDAMTKQFQ